MSQNETEEYITFLPNKSVEIQASEDLTSFARKLGKKIIYPVYPEELLETLWDVKVRFLDHVTDTDGEEVLACFAADEKCVFVNSSDKGVEGRVAFSLAHEAGHVSIHNFLTKTGKGKKEYCGNGTTTKIAQRIEQQADVYAAALLMPEYEVIQQLVKLGHSRESEIDLLRHEKTLCELFGVSYQALEMRLARLGVKVSGGFYSVRSIRSPEKYYEEAEKVRSDWHISKKRLR